MTTTLIVCTAAAVIILVPQRLRAFLNQFFALLVTPPRELALICSNYLSNYSSMNRRLLQKAGINNNYLQQSIGSLFAFATAVLSILADIDMVILSLEAMNLGNGTAKGIFLSMGVSPAALLTISLLSAITFWGIVCLDAFGVTHWLPETFLKNENQKFSNFVKWLSVGIIAFGVVTLIAIAAFRFTAMKTNSTMAALDNADWSQLTQIPFQVLIVFAFMSVLTLITAIAGAMVMPAVVMLVLVLLLAITLIPTAVGYFIGNLLDRMITLLFNVFISLFNIIEGLFAGLSRFIKRVGRINDSVEEPEEPPANEQQTNPLPPGGNDGNGGNGVDGGNGENGENEEDEEEQARAAEQNRQTERRTAARAAAPNQEETQNYQEFDNNGFTPFD